MVNYETSKQGQTHEPGTAIADVELVAVE